LAKQVMNDSKNPLSPHLQIYRWQISSLLSIAHRITGILNLLGLIFISAWISSAGIGENLFEYFSVFLKSFIGKFILIGFTWSISYHLLSGIRHFFWDLGYGYEIKTVNISGVIVIISSLLLTVFLWLIGRGLI
ncbi:MAG: succinate dehydrogenase, cytochrome b556 subunit, partial [Gammaproteobacteria bacterium]